MDIKSEEDELPEGFHTTDGTEDIEPVEVVEDEELADDDTNSNTALFENAFGTGQTVFGEGEEDAKEFLDIFTEAKEYEDR